MRVSCRDRNEEKISFFLSIMNNRREVWNKEEKQEAKSVVWSAVG